ncbi:MAG: hypothetical protein A2Z99_10170 [Treponema sp. GWB1_62_6]|nr:MAG: hypothetical protein A2Z99_10170 [Treponema sp. GWB1_62_6]HCM27787.1 dihydrolipoamide acetyltransferase [Treponema sp.]
MASSVIMPKAGMAMEEGVIVAWLKKAGDAVVRGEPIAEIETDKAVMELEAEADGVLLTITRGVGEKVPVTEVIAWIGQSGEIPPATATAKATAKAAATPAATKLASSPIPATPAARRIAGEAGIELASLLPPPGGVLHADDVRRHIRKDATPLASRIAEAAAMDPGAVPRFEGRRAHKADVEAALRSRTPSSGDPQATGDRRIPLTAIQRITGERLARSHAEIPSVTLFALADATRFLAVRKELNAEGSIRISVNDLVIRACAKALLANPRANAVIDGDGLILKGGIHIGVAVATDTGLLVPTLRDAARLSLPELSLRVKDLAGRARARRLRPEELEGGTFTISNIGMYGGATSFTPIINQPQVGILGIGALEERLFLEAGVPVVRTMLHLSFSFDHRALDGAESSSFIKAVKDLIERPLLILA